MSVWAHVLDLLAPSNWWYFHPMDWIQPGPLFLITLPIFPTSKVKTQLPIYALWLIVSYFLLEITQQPKQGVTIINIEGLIKNKFPPDCFVSLFIIALFTLTLPPSNLQYLHWYPLNEIFVETCLFKQKNYINYLFYFIIFFLRLRIYFIILYHKKNIIFY